MIKKLTEKDIVPRESIDRVFCKLTLDDYDWMKYTFEIEFPLKEDMVIANVEYYGATTCIMKVLQIDCHGKVIDSCDYEFDAKLFIKHLTSYMNSHIESWNDTYAFSPDDEALSLYNDILENGVLKKQMEGDKDEQNS